MGIIKVWDIGESGSLDATVVLCRLINIGVRNMSTIYLVDASV